MEKDPKKEETNQNDNIKAMQKLVELSEKRTQMAAGRSYMNAERTLSVWVRTALSSMIFGIAIDRLGLMFRGLSEHPHSIFGQPSTSSTITGGVLVLFSVLMSLSAGIRFIFFTRVYKKEFPTPAHHKVWLPVTYAFMVVFFGIVLTVLMWIIG